MPIFHRVDREVLPEPSGEPSEDVSNALKRGVVVVIGISAGALGAILVALSEWAITTLTH